MTGFQLQTAQETVLRELRRRINDGELRPGTVIRVDSVAEALRVSRIPVREALMLLEGQGLVIHRPHVGFAVPSLTAEEIEEAYWLRALLEDEGLRRAPGNATDADRAATREACAAAEQALAEGEVNAFSEHGLRFHAAILRSCGKPRLLRLLQNLWDTTETYRPARYVDEAAWKELQVEHRAMLEAFLTGDADRLIDVAELHRQHLLAGALLASNLPHRDLGPAQT